MRRMASPGAIRTERNAVRGVLSRMMRPGLRRTVRRAFRWRMRRTERNAVSRVLSLGARALVLVLVGATALLGAGCDRETTRVRGEVGAGGTRAIHARDAIEQRSDEAAERGADAEARPDAEDAAKASEELRAIPETGLEVGDIEVLSSDGEMAIERQSWAFEGIRGVAYRVRLPRDAARLRVVPSEVLTPLAELVGEREAPFAAVNGGFYDVDGEAMGLVTSGGKEHAPLRRNGGSGIVSERGGELRITHRSDWEGGADEALQSIDRIIAEGKSLMTEGRRERHTARSAVALGAQHAWLVVAFELASIVEAGPAIQLRSTSFRGLPLWAFARYLLETTDVVDALNLDGAVSTQFLADVGDMRVEVRGEKATINGVILEPR